jgi:SAM-dependent methyltransferase
MTPESILDQQARHWGETVERHGPNFKGVDYSNPERVQLCFRQLTGIWNAPGPASVLDYGCGYGALLGYLRDKGFALSRYTGFDVSAPMLAHARTVNAGVDGAVFTDDATALEPADYVICGGIFNVKLDADTADWHRHVVGCLERIWPLARRGMAFNILTSYSDPDKQRPDLYYADPCWFFDYCKRHFSRDVALLHDYGVYEFTMHVRR